MTPHNEGIVHKSKVDPLTIDGWMSMQELQWLSEHAARYQSIVEIGSWKGRSTAALLSTCPGIVTAVDHFKGSASEMDRHHEALQQDIHGQFLANVGSFSNLRVLKMDSAEASTHFTEGSVDMVFIDGDHDAASVAKDIALWRSKCTRLICGHDRDWPGVQTALRESGIKWTDGPGVLWYAHIGAEDGVSTPPLKMSRKGIALAVVSGRGFTPLAMLRAVAFQGWPTNSNVTIITMQGKDIDAGRTAAVEEALAQGNKYIWFIDDDTVPPQDAGRHLIYLLEQHPKAMVAGGIYTTRAVPPEPIVYMEQGAGCHWDWKVGEAFRCWGIGTGCMMINLEVFKHIQKPWFVTTNEADRKGTDDLYFCDLVNKAGFEVWAAGAVLCHHYDLERGAVYMLPRNSRPYVSRLEDFKESKL